MGNSNEKSTRYDYIFHVDNPFTLQTPDGCCFTLAPNRQKQLESSLLERGFKFTEEIQTIPPENYDVFSYDKDWALVAVMGLFDKGKTWIINRLCGLKLVSGERYHTEGLSFKLGDVATRSIFMDTAGSHSPVSDKFLKKAFPREQISLPTAIAMKKYSETFQRELILRLADVIIMVIGELTWPDQEYIESAFEKLSILKKIESATLIVLHNFKTCMNKKDLKEKQEYYITSNFKLDSENGKYYYEIRKLPSGKQVTIKHFFLICDDTSDGRELNDANIQEIREVCKTKTSTVTDGKHIGKRVIDTVKECLKPIALSTTQTISLNGRKSNQSIMLTLSCSSPFFDGKNIKAISSNFNYSLGSQFFQPQYDILENDDKLVRIVIDVGGEFIVRTQIQGNLVKVSGKKLLSHISVQPDGKFGSENENWVTYEASSASHQTRDHGDFELQIPLPIGYEKVTLRDTNRKKVSGLFIIDVVKPSSEVMFVQD